MPGFTVSYSHYLIRRITYSQIDRTARTTISARGTITVSLPFLLHISEKLDTAPMIIETITLVTNAKSVRKVSEIKQATAETSIMAALPSHDLLLSASLKLILCLPKGLPIQAAAISPNPQAAVEATRM